MKAKENRLNISENDLMEYISQQMIMTPKRPKGYGVTCIEFANKYGMGEAKARRRLNELVREKKLQSQMMIDNSHIVVVYFK
jgi:hypothetical protein